jgi:hypothetical protein
VYPGILFLRYSGFAKVELTLLVRTCRFAKDDTLAARRVSSHRKTLSMVVSPMAKSQGYTDRRRDRTEK